MQEAWGRALGDADTGEPCRRLAPYLYSDSKSPPIALNSGLGCWAKHQALAKSELQIHSK